jgi:trk system potassium uptake protein TrkA
MEALIYGTGPLTTRVIPYLAQSGYRVAVLDSSRDALDSLVADRRVQGILITEPLMQDYLQDGGIKIADLFLALSDKDQENALLSQIARHIFNVPKVICRLENSDLQQLYSGLGLSVVGSSIQSLAQNVSQAIEA